MYLCRTLAKHHQDACAVAYADDGYIKAKLSVALEVLSDLKHVLKEDARRSRRPSFSSRVFRRPTRTLPPCACSLPITPLITSVLCSLLRALWLTATLALGFPSALMPLSSIL